MRSDRWLNFFLQTIMKFIRILAVAQVVYIAVTALWPLVDIKSFMEITGPKTDVWLVKTVAALLLPISLTMSTLLYTARDQRSLFVLGASTAAAFLVVDLYYSLNDVISDIYLLDAVIEFFFLIGWAVVVFRKPPNQS
jgi:hypothetical protein